MTVRARRAHAFGPPLPLEPGFEARPGAADFLVAEVRLVAAAARGAVLVDALVAEAEAVPVAFAVRRPVAAVRVPLLAAPLAAAPLAAVLLAAVPRVRAAGLRSAAFEVVDPAVLAAFVAARAVFGFAALFDVVPAFFAVAVFDPVLLAAASFGAARLAEARVDVLEPLVVVAAGPLAVSLLAVAATFLAAAFVTPVLEAVLRAVVLGVEDLDVEDLGVAALAVVVLVAVVRASSPVFVFPFGMITSCQGCRARVSMPKHDTNRCGPSRYA